MMLGSQEYSAVAMGRPAAVLSVTGADTIRQDNH
jgi:hypothetical protein